MILCEVALGIPKIGRVYGIPMLDDEMPPPCPYSVGKGGVLHLPNDEYQSIQYLENDASTIYQEIDGVRIAKSCAQSLELNEFVVFDPNQIKIKYLFKLKLW